MRKEYNWERLLFYFHLFCTYFAPILAVLSSDLAPNFDKILLLLFLFWLSNNTEAQSLLNGTEFSTNSSESWNSVSKLTVVAKPTIWQLIHQLQTENTKDAAKLKTLWYPQHIDLSSKRSSSIFEASWVVLYSI